MREKFLDLAELSRSTLRSLSLSLAINLLEFPEPPGSRISLFLPRKRP